MGESFLACDRTYFLNGISHLTFPPHTPQHNEISERKHRHIVETGLTLLNQASIPLNYWTYAFAATIYLINRIPTPVLAMDSPFHKLFGSHPNYQKLRVFGCLCFPCLRPYADHKLDSRSSSCVFFRYSFTQSAYLCLDIATSRLYTSRHVQFQEHVFPFAKPQKLSSPTTLNEPSHGPLKSRWSLQLVL